MLSAPPARREWEPTKGTAAVYVLLHKFNIAHKKTDLNEEATEFTVFCRQIIGIMFSLSFFLAFVTMGSAPFFPGKGQVLIENSGTAFPFSLAIIGVSRENLHDGQKSSFCWLFRRVR